MKVRREEGQKNNDLKRSIRLLSLFKKRKRSTAPLVVHQRAIRKGFLSGLDLKGHFSKNALRQNACALQTSLRANLKEIKSLYKWNMGNTTAMCMVGSSYNRQSKKSSALI